MKISRSFSISLALAFLLFTFVATSHAQGPVELAGLTIKLWPEYDDPRLLVIIDAQLVEPGAQIRLPLPEGAQLNAVATADDAGRLLKNDYTEEKSEDGTRLLVMTPDNTLFRVEYYAPIPANEQERIIDFSLPAGYFNSEKTAIEVLVPPGSKEIVLDPPTDGSGPTQDNAHLFQRAVGAVKDQDIQQKVVYKNPGGALTVPENPTTSSGASQPSAKPAASTQSDDAGSGLNPLFIGLAAAALLLIAGGAAGLWLTREKEPAPAATSVSARVKKPRKRHQKTSGMQPRAGNWDRFCRKCGEEFGPDDRFCRYCGEARQKI